jgi:Domain of unknown function (DUF4328)
MTNNFSTEIYSSTKTLSYLAIGCFSILILCYCLFTIAGFLQVAVDLPDVTLNTGQTVPVSLVVIGLVSLVEMLARLLTIIFFLIWLYKAFKNLSGLQCGYLEFSPGWAVGWWFIPFANLVKPYQIVGELWRQSDSDFDARTFLSNQIGTASIIGWWWGLFIGGNIVGRISDAMIDAGSQYFPIALVLACILHGISAYLIIEIIRTVTDQQELRFQKLGTLNKFIEPPAPPKFN